MELSCKAQVNAAKEAIWPLYVDAAKRRIWEEDLEHLVVDGELKAGTTGKVKLQHMPEMQFMLTEVIEYASYCDRTEVPGIGGLYFDHYIVQENGKTFIQHTIRLEKENMEAGDLAFLCGVFSDVPESIMKIKHEVEK